MYNSIILCCGKAQDENQLEMRRNVKGWHGSRPMAPCLQYLCLVPCALGKLGIGNCPWSGVWVGGSTFGPGRNGAALWPWQQVYLHQPPAPSSFTHRYSSSRSGSGSGSGLEQMPTAVSAARERPQSYMPPRRTSGSHFPSKGSQCCRRGGRWQL